MVGSRSKKDEPKKVFGCWKRSGTKQTVQLGVRLRFQSVAEFKEFERTLQWFRAHDCALSEGVRWRFLIVGGLLEVFGGLLLMFYGFWRFLEIFGGCVKRKPEGTCRTFIFLIMFPFTYIIGVSLGTFLTDSHFLRISSSPARGWYSNVS